MSRKYEGLIVLDTKGKEASVDELVSTVGKQIEEGGGKLDEVINMGRKKFAYNARQIEAGHYVNYIFEASPEAITGIKDLIRLNEDVYLQNYTRLA